MHWRDACAESPRFIATRKGSHPDAQPMYRYANGLAFVLVRGELLPLYDTSKVEGWNDWEPLMEDCDGLRP